MPKSVIQQGWDTGSRLMPYFHLPSLVNRWLHAAFSIHSSSTRRSGLVKKRVLVLCSSLFWRRLLRILGTQPRTPTGPVPLSVEGGWGISRLAFPASPGEVCGISQATTCHRELEPRMLNMSETKTLRVTFFPWLHTITFVAQMLF